MLAVLKWLTPGMVVVDVGAHIGTFSLAAAALGARVLAFEALPANFALLAAGKEANRFELLEAVNSAIGEREGWLEFFDSGPYGSRRYDAVPAEQSGIRVQATTIDHALAERDIDRVDLLKIDIEGSEMFALEGMQELLAQPEAPALFIESNAHALAFHHQTPNELVALLESFGYTCFEIVNRLRPFTSADFQYDCVVDYFALKGRVRDSLQPLVGPGPSLQETIDGITRNVGHPNIHFRLHLVRALEHAPEALRAHQAVVQALERLSEDTYEEVRTRARRLLERG